jgi:hypothetical protein
VPEIPDPLHSAVVSFPIALLPVGASLDAWLEFYPFLVLPLTAKHEPLFLL